MQGRFETVVVVGLVWKGVLSRIRLETYESWGGGAAMGVVLFERG